MPAQALVPPPPLLLYSCGLYSYGLYSYGLYRYGLSSYGLPRRRCHRRLCCCIVMAYIVMAYIGVTYIVVVYLVMACPGAGAAAAFAPSSTSVGLCLPPSAFSFFHAQIYSYGLYDCGLYSYGLAAERGRIFDAITNPLLGCARISKALISKIENFRSSL